MVKVYIADATVLKDEQLYRRLYSGTQKGIFVESVANAGTTIYNIPLLFKLSAKVDH